MGVKYIANSTMKGKNNKLHIVLNATVQCKVQDNAKKEGSAMLMGRGQCRVQLLWEVSIATVLGNAKKEGSAMLRRGAVQ